MLHELGHHQNEPFREVIALFYFIYGDGRHNGNESLVDGGIDYFDTLRVEAEVRNEFIAHRIT